MSDRWNGQYCSQDCFDNRSGPRRTWECKVGLVGSGLGGGFNNISELYLMNYEESINEPDDNAWKQQVENKHKQMIFKKNQVWNGTRILGLVWSIKKQADGIFVGRLTTHRCS